MDASNLMVTVMYEEIADYANNWLGVGISTNAAMVKQLTIKCEKHMSHQK